MIQQCYTRRVQKGVVDMGIGAISGNSSALFQGIQNLQNSTANASASTSFVPTNPTARRAPDLTGSVSGASVGQYRNIQFSTTAAFLAASQQNGALQPGGSAAAASSITPSVMLSSDFGQTHMTSGMS